MFMPAVTRPVGSTGSVSEVALPGFAAFNPLSACATAVLSLPPSTWTSRPEVLAQAFKACWYIAWAWLAPLHELAIDPLAPPQEMMTLTPLATRPSIADFTLVPFGNMALETLPSPPAHVA